MVTVEVSYNVLTDHLFGSKTKDFTKFLSELNFCISNRQNSHSPYEPYRSVKYGRAKAKLKQQLGLNTAVYTTSVFTSRS